MSKAKQIAQCYSACLHICTGYVLYFFIGSIFLLQKVIFTVANPFPYTSPFCNGNCRNQDVYQCGDLDKFIETVTEKVESLPAKRIAEVLNGFLQKYELKILSVNL